MRRTFRLALAAAALTVGWHGSLPVAGQVPDAPPGVPQFLFQGPGGPGRAGATEQRFPDFNVVTRGAKEYDGLFKLHQKDDNLYMEIRPEQMNKPFLCPVAVARGAGMGGHTLNFDEQWVLIFKRQGDKVHLVRRNVHFKAKPGSPMAKAVETTYTDSVLQAVRIAAINPMRQAVLINLNEIFMTDFAQLRIGAFDASRSVWNKIKTFPRNIELQVQATYAGGRGGILGMPFADAESNIDSRGRTVVIHYGLCELPEGGYQPRVADDRVGHFLSAVKDFSSDSKDDAFVRYVNRWRLERAEPLDPKNPTKLSVPKKSIKFYIEKTVPHEYRAAVQEGILEWNKAFEKIGYRNAIEVVQQRDDEDFDPEDMNYNTFRWITTGAAFAMGPSRANPLTGEILDADIIFDADMVRVWKHQAQVFNSNGEAYSPASPIQAMEEGWGLDHTLLRRPSTGWADSPKRLADDPVAARLRAIQQGVCQCGMQMHYELGMAAMAAAAGEALKPGDKIPDELIQQAVKETVMHEVGHTLGLRHNFKASTMLKNDQLHDTKITREKGLVGSVMDYSPVNLAPKGVKQGDYFTTTIGPYDYWAIEYAYKPIQGNEAEELKKIANRGATTGLDYATDEDIVLSSDPLTNQGDLGSDVMKFAQDRMLLAEDLMKEMANKVVDDGEGYQRARVAFTVLLAQYGNGARLVSKYVGGEHANRDHRGDPNGRDPLVPVSAAKQRDALKFLQEHTFSDKAFQFPPELLRRLAVERWSHWGLRPESADFPLYDKVLGIQKVALNRLLSPTVLRRVQNNALKSKKEDQPLTLAEVFRCVTDGVWTGLPNGPTNGNGAAEGEKKPMASSIVRRNLQREHVKALTGLVLGKKSSEFGGLTLEILLGLEQATPTVPPDARSLARSHLRELSKRIQTALADKNLQLDETTQAHLEESRERIQKVLTASMQVND